MAGSGTASAFFFGFHLKPCGELRRLIVAIPQVPAIRAHAKGGHGHRVSDGSRFDVAGALRGALLMLVLRRRSLCCPLAAGAASALVCLFIVGTHYNRLL